MQLTPVETRLLGADVQTIRESDDLLSWLLEEGEVPEALQILSGAFVYAVLQCTDCLVWGKYGAGWARCLCWG